MRKTYCDRCGEECHYRNGHLHLSEQHRTASGQEVGMDEYGPADLCGACIDLLREWVGEALAVTHYGGPPDEMMNARPVPAPFMLTDLDQPPPPPEVAVRGLAGDGAQ